MPSLGEMAVLGRLLEEHRPKLLAMLQRRIDPTLQVRVDPEDILSDVFVEARRRWPRCRDQVESAAYAWLYRLTKDCLIEAWRKHNRKCRDPDREIPWPDRSSVQLGLGLVEPKTSPSEAVARSELSQQMKEVLQLLRAGDREVLWMRHFDELSFAELAIVLNLTENAATVRYIRALRRLKDLWRQIHGLEP